MDKTPNKYWTAYICLALALTTFAVFWQLHSYDFVYYDDPVYVTENTYVQSGLTGESIRWAFTATHDSNWHPLTWLSHMVDCQLFGINPGSHHMVNLLLHIANTLLLFAVFKRMTGMLWQSAFVAALFALHPLHVESVAWISERKDTLSTFFGLLTIAAYLKYNKHSAYRWYLLMIITFVLALMTKPMLVTLPFVLLLLDYWPLERFQKGSNFQLIREKIPLFICSVISCVITLLVEAKGAGAGFDKLSLKARIANTFFAYMTYIIKMFWPNKLAVLYPHLVENIPMPKVIMATFLLIAFSIIVIRLATSRRYLIVGWLWYLGTLVPVIGLVQVGDQAMADRYSYMTLTGLFIIIAWGLPELLVKWRYREILLGISASAVLCILSVCTWFQVGYWQNSETLFKHALKVTNNNVVIHYNLGTMLVREGKWDDAINHFHSALQIKPDNVEIINNLAGALLKKDKYDEAISYFYQALKIDPDDTDIHYNLANALQSQGKLDEAISHYYRALRLKPDDADLHINLGLVFKSQGKFEQAIGHYNQALQIKPDYAKAHNNMGSVLLIQGKYDEAISYFRKALQINPEYIPAKHNLNIALELQGKTE